MKIQKIKIENFKSIYEPLEINFNDVKGLWKISGSVGSGKTSIGEAIIYGLFGSVGGKNQADLVSWGRKHGSIDIWCVSKGHSIYIKRELKTYGSCPIYVEVDGEELMFTNKRDAQLQLEQEYYDISKMTLEQLCIISFNNFKSLATLNTTDTKKFLDQVLGFEALSQYAEICKNLKSDNRTELLSISSSIDKLNSQIFKLEELSNVERIEGDVNSSVLVLNELNAQLKQLNSLYTEDISSFNKEKSDLTKKQAAVLALGKNKKKEIDFIEKGVCPTCGAPIDQSQLEIKKQEKDSLLDQYNSIGNEIKIVDQKISSRTQQYNSDITPIKSDIDKIKTLIVRLEEQAKRLNINLGEIETLKSELQELDKKLIHHQKEDAEWDQLYNILTVQVRTRILQSFIPSLNKNILKYSQRLHLPYIVQFDQNFKCQISLCGPNQEIPISSLSTGQLKTVDMIVILGVLGTVIGSNGLNVLFLDELFSNLDAGLRNELCQVLKESMDSDTTVFIISHTDFEDKYFDGDIYMKLQLQDQYEKHSVHKITKFEGI